MTPPSRRYFQVLWFLFGKDTSVAGCDLTNEVSDGIRKKLINSNVRIPMCSNRQNKQVHFFVCVLIGLFLSALAENAYLLSQGRFALSIKFGLIGINKNRNLEK